MAVALALAVGLACGDDGPTEPVPGTLVVSLTTPNSDDGAILFTISGGGVDDPAAVATSHRMFFRTTGTSTTTAVVVGNITSGPLLRFEVLDVGEASSFTGTITEVADRNNELRASLSGYSLAISRE
jgi:hypothetical protein